MKTKPTYKELENEIEILQEIKNIIERSQVVVFLWKNQENWPVEFVSTNVKSIFGYSGDEFMEGKIVYGEIIHPDDLQRVTRDVSENSKANSVFFSHQPYRIICKTGKIKWIKDDTHIRRNKNGKITHYEGIILDITKQVEIEADLIKLNTAIEKSINEVFIFGGEDLKFSFTNQGAIQNLGYTWQELKTISPWDIKPEYSRVRFMKTILPLKNDIVNNLQFKTIHQRKDGTLYPVEVNLSKFTINNKLHFLALIIDITKRLKKEKELIIAKEKAEESDRLKTEFIDNMSHEIRTPMNGILGFSNFLNNPGLTNKRRKHYINIIQNSGNQLIRIIDDILETSKLGTKQVKAIDKEFCLNDLLLELFSIFDIKAKENKTPLYLKKGLSDKESTIITDETKLNKIISNLLENALKFTNAGFIEFGYRLTNNKLEIYVKDTGIGIKPEKQETIFERFSQEEKELSQKVGGLGLGLSIAKENAELIGGKVTLNSEKGKGSTFFVTIPYRPTVLGTELKKSIPAPEKKQKEYTILIVEDEEINYLYIETLLENEIELECGVIHAKNGNEAVDICKDNSKIDFVLMDLKMPIMNGYQATKLIKELRPNLPIVAQTAHSTEEAKEQAKSAGCDNFISKPISEETLNEIINQYLTTK